jgi:threonylcarbamoyladenosine tRNA methylthiotransferase MtaB
VRAEVASVTVRTLGCKVNRSESEALAEALGTLGVTVSPDGNAVGCVVVNTCTVTAEADAKARKEVRRALEATCGPVVATGCLAAVDSASLRAIDPRVVVEPDRSRLARTVAALLLQVAPDRARRSTGPPARAAAGRTRALVKVQDGCDNRCAYCIVPDARGLPRSVPADAIVCRTRALVTAGTAEVVLTGVNIGRYRDGAGGLDLAALVSRVAATGIARIRLSSIEPPDVSARLLEVLAATPAVVPHLHVPLQSGSDRVLAAMGRRYDTAGYAAVLGAARGALPGLAVTTDVIAGFPGETGDDFAGTLESVERCGFAGLHVFRYSARAGTPAADAPDQVPAGVRSERARLLRDLGERLRARYARSRDGGSATLLVEALAGDGVARGTTEDHLRVSAALRGARVGELVPVRLTVSDDGAVRGYYVGDGREPV